MAILSRLGASQSISLVVLYLSIYGTYGVLLPFMPLIFRGQGLSDGEISFSLSMIGVAALLGPPCFGILLDRYFRFAKLLPFACLILILLSPLFGTVSSAFTASILVLSFFFIFFPILTLADQYTLTVLTTTATPTHFQRFRAIGSLGFMIPAIILWVNSKSGGVLTDNLPGMATVSLIVILFVAFALPPATLPQRVQRSPMKQAFQLILKTKYCQLFGACFLAGVAQAVLYVLLPRYLEELGYQKAEIGLLSNLAVVGEVFLIPFASRIIEKCGALQVITFGIFCLSIRLLLLGFFPSPEIAILTQLLHPVIVLALFVVIPIFLHQISSSDFRYSLQSVYTMLVYGVARISGPLLAALILRSSTMQGMRGLCWCLSAAGVVAACASLWMLALLRTKTYPAEE